MENIWFSLVNTDTVLVAIPRHHVEAALGDVGVTVIAVLNL